MVELPNSNDSVSDIGILPSPRYSYCYARVLIEYGKLRVREELTISKLNSDNID